MYIRESDAKGHICHRTISPDKDGKPCRGTECMAWEEIEWKMSPCPHCKKEITSIQADGESWGRCAARWK